MICFTTGPIGHSPAVSVCVCVRACVCSMCVVVCVGEFTPLRILSKVKMALKTWLENTHCHFMYVHMYTHKHTTLRIVRDLLWVF